MSRLTVARIFAPCLAVGFAMAGWFLLSMVALAVWVLASTVDEDAGYEYETEDDDE